MVEETIKFIHGKRADSQKVESGIKDRIMSLDNNQHEKNSVSESELNDRPELKSMDDNVLDNDILVNSDGIDYKKDELCEKKDSLNRDKIVQLRPSLDSKISSKMVEEKRNSTIEERSFASPFSLKKNNNDKRLYKKMINGLFSIAANNESIPEVVRKQRQKDQEKHGKQVEEWRNLDLEVYQHAVFQHFVQQINDNLKQHQPKYQLIQKHIEGVENKILSSFSSLLKKDQNAVTSKIVKSKWMVQVFQTASIDLLNFIDPKQFKKKSKQKNKGKSSKDDRVKDSKLKEDFEQGEKKELKTIFVGNLAQENESGLISHNEDDGVSEDEHFSDFTDIEEITPKKRNRIGQRRRREMWEKMYGKQANHIKNQTERENKKYKKEEKSKKNQHRNVENHKRPRQEYEDNAKYSHDRSSSKRSKIGNSQSRNMTNDHNPKNQNQSLHPSWEAKKKQNSIAEFTGKKITFDNDSD